MDLPPNDEDKKSNDSDQDVPIEEEAAAATGDDDLTIDLQSLALTTPEKSKGDIKLVEEIRGRPILGRPSKRLSIPRVQELQFETLSSPPKNQPKRNSNRQLNFPDPRRELSPASGNQPVSPLERSCPMADSSTGFQERQTTPSSSTDPPRQRRTPTSSEDYLRQRWTGSSLEEDPNQQCRPGAFAKWGSALANTPKPTRSSLDDELIHQPLPSLSADALRKRWTGSSAENDPKQPWSPSLSAHDPTNRWTGNSPEDEAKTQPSSSADALKRRLARSAPEDEANQQSTPSSSVDSLKRRWSPSTPEDEASQQPTSSSSADSLKRRLGRRTSEDEANQQTPPSSSADSLKRRWPRNTPEDKASQRTPPSSSADSLKRRWPRNTPEDEASQQTTPNSSADSPKLRWAQSSPDDAATTQRCKAPASSPAKGVPEHIHNFALDVMDRLWDRTRFQNALISPPKAKTKRTIETAACGSDCGPSSPDAKRHRREPRDQFPQGSAGQGSSDPSVRRVRKRRYSSGLEMTTEGQEKKSKDDKKND